MSELIYVWHCPTCAHNGRTCIKPVNDVQMCIVCGDVLIIETMIPLYLFKD
jgi:hypothetical protein